MPNYKEKSTSYTQQPHGLELTEKTLYMDANICEKLNTLRTYNGRED